MRTHTKDGTDESQIPCQQNLSELLAERDPFPFSHRGEILRSFSKSVTAIRLRTSCASGNFSFCGQFLREFLVLMEVPDQCSRNAFTKYPASLYERENVRARALSWVVQESFSEGVRDSFFGELHKRTTKRRWKKTHISTHPQWYTASSNIQWYTVVEKNIQSYTASSKRCLRIFLLVLSPFFSR